MSVNELEEGLYGIGAVSERTGLTAAGIRMWEKRYGAVVPDRTETNRRLYRSSDVERLVLLKKLTDHGHAISRIANLDLDRLSELVDELKEVERSEESDVDETSPAVRSRVAVISPSLGELLGDMDLFEADVVATAESLEQAAEDAGFPEVEMLIVEVESLFLETIGKLREVVGRCGSKTSLVVYRFASSRTVTALAKVIDGVSLIKAPVTDIQLRRQCLVQLNALRPKTADQATIRPGPIPERLYDQDQLARLSRISTTIECECPQHLAELLKGLSAFERYSEECEDRNSEDALLHAFLHRTTAHVRRTMEEALRHLIQSEGIEF